MPTEVNTTNTEEKIVNAAADAVLDNVNNSNSLGGILIGAGGTLAIILIGVVAKKAYDNRKAVNKEHDEKKVKKPKNDQITEEDEEYYED